MNWFYAENGQQRGPVTEADLQALLAAGKINSETLVWREGMAEWQPWRQAGAAANAIPGGTAATADSGATGSVVCSECGRSFPPSEVIRHGAVFVCGSCKPIFLQKLKEGAALNTGALEYASFGLRFGAKLLDGIILWIGQLIIGFVAGLLMTVGGGDEATGMILFQVVLIFFSLVVNFVYNIFFIGKFGATPGKMACKIKVVQPDGSPVGYGRATGRAFGEIVSGIICYIGYLMMIWDEEKRTLHDRMANTRVVKR
jgi:uncharacterized RDD family membrane protein YckC